MSRRAAIRETLVLAGYERAGVNRVRALALGAGHPDHPAFPFRVERTWSGSRGETFAVVSGRDVTGQDVLAVWAEMTNSSRHLSPWRHTLPAGVQILPATGRGALDRVVVDLETAAVVVAAAHPRGLATVLDGAVVEHLPAHVRAAVTSTWSAVGDEGAAAVLASFQAEVERAAIAVREAHLTAHHATR